MKNEKLSYVIERLRKNERFLTAISLETGMSRRTLYRTMRSETVPTLETLDKLYSYLKRTSRVSK